MLHKISVLMLLAGFAAMNVAAQRRDLNADRQAIIALEELWLNAYDASTLDRILANDFRHPVVTGQFLTKQQHIDWMVAHPPPPTRKARFEQMDVRLFGDVAIAAGIVVTDGVTPAPLRTIFTDVFVRRNSRWQAISAQENEIVTRVNRPDVSKGQ